MDEIKLLKEDHILILAPHPDDECIGIGGLLSKYACNTDVWVMTDGRYGSKKKYNKGLVETRKKEFVSEMKYLGVNNYKLFGIEDGTLRKSLEILNQENLSEYNVIFAPHHAEVHPDHQATYQIAYNAIKNQALSDIAFFQYEITTPMYNPTHFMDITDNIRTKLNCIDMHESQKMLLDYREIAKALNSFRANVYGMRNSFIEVYKYTRLGG